MEQTDLQKRIEDAVTNGRGFHDSPERILGDFKPATYTGTFDPESNMTFGISEYGPWSAPGDARLY